MSGAQAQQKQEELLDLSQRERNAKRGVESAQRELAATLAELAAGRIQMESQRSQLERQLSGLDQERSEVDSRTRWTLTAPRRGVVSALNANVGQSASAGFTLISVLPQQGQQPTDLVAQLYAPSRTSGFVRSGQTVWIRYAAYPYQKFGVHKGRVTGVSETPINPQDLPPGQSVQTAEPLYRITVSLEAQQISAYGSMQPLKAGMTLDAQIDQEQRALWEWALEPMLAIVGRFKNSGN